MSTLRARCPDCRTLTAVAVEDAYECHRCGRVFASGLVRVRSAWGEGGEAMKDGAMLPLPRPEVATVETETLEEQSDAVAAALPARPLVLGGCCCAHVGAIRGLAARHRTLAVVWLDAHGDLNTPESSPTGNAWGMPLRLAIEEGSLAPGRVAHVGARELDPHELEYMRLFGIDGDVARAVEGAQAVYVALDVDVVRPGELVPFMPVPGGPTVAEVEELLRALPRCDGLGLTGLLGDERNVEPLTRLAAAAGL